MNHSSTLALVYPQLLRLAEGSLEKAYQPVPDAHAQAIKAARFGAALKTLQRGLTGERNLAGATYFSTQEFLGAYLLYYWPVSFLQTSMALAELESRRCLPKLHSVLDLGAGPGPAACAVIIGGASDITLLDKSKEALDMAVKLIASIGEKKTLKMTASVANLECLLSLPEGPFDLILASHSANELWKQDSKAFDKRAALFGQAIEKLADGGLLIIIEPSALVTSRPALALRDRLLSEFEGALRCIAPCPGSYPCPALAAGSERSCHSTWTWKPDEPITALAAAAGLDRDSVKATWFALQKTGTTLSNTTALASQYSPAQLATQRATLEGRIISEAMLNKAGRVRYILCTSSGLATLSAKAKDSAAEVAGFFSLQRGDMIKAASLERREGENNFGFVSDSTLNSVIKAPEA